MLDQLGMRFAAQACRVLKQDHVLCRKELLCSKNSSSCVTVLQLKLTSDLGTPGDSVS